MAYHRSVSLWMTGKLPSGVTVETLPMTGDLSEDQSAWKRFSVDIYPKVTVKESTDSHGLPSVSVAVDDGQAA